MKTIRESIVFGFSLGVSILFLVAATPIKNLVFQGDADARGYSITNLSSGTNASNAATIGYVDAATGSLSGVIPLSKGGTGQTNGILSANISDATAAGRSLLKVFVQSPQGSDQAFVLTLSGNVSAVETTGTGSMARANSPSFVTPSLGAATASSLNRLAITAPATRATLAISDNKTLSVTSNVTLTGDGNATRTLDIGSGGTLGSSAFTSADAYEPKGKFPVIIIPVPPGSRWTDFELKATTNNFTNDATGMVFWYHSPDPAKLVMTGQRWTNRPDVYFTDSGKTGTPNQRAWIKQNDTQSIFEMLTDANSEVGGFIIIIQDDLSDHRDHLVFSYSFLDATTGENDPANRGVWRPVWPQEWVNSFDIIPSSP